MGAQDFFVRASGKDVAEAFRSAVDEALFEYGHRGYTGTIAEKGTVTMFKVPEGISASQFARDALYGESDGRVAEVAHDKWGPACGVELTGKDLEEARADYERGRGYTTTYIGNKEGVREKLGPEPEALKFFLFFGSASS